MGTTRRRVASLFTGVTVLYIILSLAYVGPAIFKGFPYIASGGPGDGTAGLTWMESVDTGGPAPDFTTHKTNYPYGDALRDPFQITSVFNIGGMWLFTHLFSAAEAWNIMVFLGYLSSALLMFAFVRWLLSNNWVAFFAGTAVTFTPYHQVNSEGHLSYMFSGFFVLLVWAFLAFWRAPSVKKAVALAGATAVCLYTDGYFVLLTGILLIGLTASVVLAEIFYRKQGWRFFLARLKPALIYIAATILLITPIVYTEFLHGSQISSTLASSRGVIGAEVTTYSARIREYIFPPLFSSWLPTNTTVKYIGGLHGSNVVENSLYLGAVVIVLGALAWVLAFQKHGRKQVVRDYPLPFLLIVLSGAAFVAFVTSLQPRLYLFHHVIPMPSWIVYHLTASWRVYARLYLLVDLLLVVVAAIGLHLIVKNWSRSRQVLVVGAITAITLIDMLTQARASQWSYYDLAYTYRWLRTQPQVKVLAEYPLDVPPSDAIISYLTAQQIHGKSIINTSRADSPQKMLQISISRLGDAQTLPVLKALGTDVVLSHGTSADGISGLTFIRKDMRGGFNNVWTYKLDSTVAPVDYAIVPNFNVIDGGSTPLSHKFAIGGSGSLGFYKLGKSSAKSVTVDIDVDSAATGQPASVTFSQNNITLWQGDFTDAQHATFVADPAKPINIQASGQPNAPGVLLYNMIAKDN